MGRKGATPPQTARAAGDGLAGGMPSTAWWPLSTTKKTVVAGAGMALLAVVAFSVAREAGTAGTTGRAPGFAPAQPVAATTGHQHHAAAPQQPALTRAEEAYIQALWPVHGDVERSALRVSLGNILYKTSELGKPELKLRVDAALAAYRQAEARIGALEPPPSLAREHEEYLAAVRLFEQGALEQMKMFEDGDEGHLLVAYPLSRAGGDRIREIGTRFWKDEFPPH